MVEVTRRVDKIKTAAVKHTHTQTQMKLTGLKLTKRDRLKMKSRRTSQHADTVPKHKSTV